MIWMILVIVFGISLASYALVKGSVLAFVALLLAVAYTVIKWEGS